MPTAISESIGFQPTARVLGAVLDEFDELGAAGGGAVTTGERRAALEAYRTFSQRDPKLPPRWRHDYAALSFSDLQWTTGRINVAALPPSLEPPVRREDAGDVPALAVENAGGLVHTGSIYLEPKVRSGDERVILTSLADGKRLRGGEAQAVHQRIVDWRSDRFTALATAFQNCGAYVEIPSGVELTAPLQLLWTARPGEAAAVFPHTVVYAGANARATVVERHVGESDALLCGIVELDLAPGARIDYVVVQQAADGARLFFTRAARCAAGATIGWHLAEFGGALARSMTRSYLVAPHANAEVNAFFFVHGFAHADLLADADHRATQTTSQTVVRTAASDRGQGRFSGTIRIQPEAGRSNASMRDDALLLSRDAYLDAVPALEIKTNDVSISHAATVGTLDEEQLFYVQSRGLSRRQAERIVALAFFEPSIVGFPSETLRDEMRTVLDERLDDVPETFVS
ncbi:MAG TPA: SufD family Fe-S cluster assembly protein [Candidatus Acidoferrales bacterium]|nr:SufD family Fe-S cluster assembly protein [Candidatus Acidoferrales bacterium]